jgi:ATP/maltotriose-dependent transcriptional regulator MalT
VLQQRLPADPLNVPDREVEMLVIRGMLNYYGARSMETLHDLRAALRLAENGAPPFQLARCHYFIAASLIRQGEWDGAAVHARTALSVATGEDMVWDEPQCHAALGMVLAYRGDLDGAEQEVATALERGAASENLEGIATAMLAASALARVRNDPQGVISQLEGIAAAPPMLSMLQFWPWFVEALIESGEMGRAEEEIDRMEAAAAERRLDVEWQIVLLRARVAAAAGRSREAVSMYAEALDHLGVNDPFLDRALAHRAFGLLLCSQGDHTGGLAQLQQAREMLAAVEAAPFVARLDADLAAAGGVANSAPSRERSNLELTDRERDVATLVAQGMSNPEVAAQLYVSRKAVEYHLHNIYGKLGIRSRRELRGRVALA